MNINCNEFNKQYYLEFENTLKQIFKKEDWLDIEYIPKVLEQMGFKIIYEDCERSGYNGDLYVLYEKDNKVYFFESAYGSCSVCDTWYGADESIDNFMSIFKDEDRSTVEFDNKEEIKEYFKNHYLFDRGFSDFIEKYCEEN